MFPPIDWHYRYQRPQQIAAALSALGHRVHYFSPDFSAGDLRDDHAVYDMDSSGVSLVRLKCQPPHPQPNVAPAAEPNRTVLEAAITNYAAQYCRNPPIAIIGGVFWWNVLSDSLKARSIYDCMDYVAGFTSSSQPLIELEISMIAEAPIAVSSSGALIETIQDSGRSGPVFHIPNATDSAMFATSRPRWRPDGGRRLVIGYIGAIEDWFDADLVIALARRRPEWRFELTGNVGPAHDELRSRKNRPANIECFGEVPFERLRESMARIDVGIIPFVDNALTRHTNPVKIYEFLAAGRPVVSVPLGELEQFGDAVLPASGAAEFEAAIERAKNLLTESDCRKRQYLAVPHTWEARAGLWNGVIQMAAIASGEA